MKANGRRVALIFLEMVCLLLAVPAVLTWRQVRQQQLNRALIEAAKRADDRAAIRLLKEGADPNCRDEPTQAVSFGQMLWDWLRGRHPQKRSDALPPLAYAAGEAVHFCAASENTALVHALLQSGADVNMTAWNGSVTALKSAVHADRSATVHLLLAHGARINPPADLLMTARHFADFVVFNDLIAHGADVNGVNERGWTPLMEACWFGDVAGMLVLLAHHADVTTQSSDGQTTLEMAQSNDRDISTAQSREIIHLLKAAGAKR